MAITIATFISTIMVINMATIVALIMDTIMSKFGVIARFIIMLRWPTIFG